MKVKFLSGQFLEGKKATVQIGNLIIEKGGKK